MKQLLRRITNWEAWPFKLLYTPISLFWLGYIIRSGAVWFFTPSNPKLTFGGMEGEPKKEMYDLLPKELYPSTVNILPGEDFEKVKHKLIDNQIAYPFVVKPEVGGQGILLRKIENEMALEKYHGKMPWEYIVQSWVKFPMEVSIFYIRHPKDEKGIVTGFLHKVPLQVIGDGKSTLGELVMQNPKAAKHLESMQGKHQENWGKIIEDGEVYKLSYAANHNRGAQFIDLKNEIDEKLVSVFDEISHKVNDFFYGRYDVMCTSVADLKEGKNFTILEYNGCGAEPNHFYDTGYTLLGAYKEILKHWKALYKISKYNAQQGIKPWSLKRGQKFITDTRKLYAAMKAVDTTIDA
ncbi:MAG: hypothetical protein V4556_00320 [Bacteroidota bacterium]